MNTGVKQGQGSC